LQSGKPAASAGRVALDVELVAVELVLLLVLGLERICVALNQEC